MTLLNHYESTTSAKELGCKPRENPSKTSWIALLLLLGVLLGASFLYGIVKLILSRVRKTGKLRYGDKELAIKQRLRALDTYRGRINQDYMVSIQRLAPEDELLNQYLRLSLRVNHCSKELCEVFLDLNVYRSLEALENFIYWILSSTVLQREGKTYFNRNLYHLSILVMHMVVVTPFLYSVYIAKLNHLPPFTQTPKQE